MSNWIKWQGGNACPLAGGTIIDAKDKDGHVWKNQVVGKSNNIDNIFWSGASHQENQIAEYRVVEQVLQSRVNDAKLEQAFNRTIAPLESFEISTDDGNDYASSLTYSQSASGMIEDPDGDWVKVSKYQYRKLHRVNALQTRVNDANLQQAFDTVQRPAHYNQSGIECIDAIAAAVKGKSGIEASLVGNVIKYLWRYELKNGVEDIQKAQWYLERLVKELSK